MSYNPYEPPERVLELGALPQGEIFRYFKESLLYIPQRYDEDLEDWPTVQEFTVGYTIKFMNDNGDWSLPINANSNMPITREEFYEYVDQFSISWTDGQAYGGITPGGEKYSNFFANFNGQPLYTIANPEGMTAMVLRHWGKIKSCELALFGSIGNGANLSDLSIESTGTLRNSVNNWKISDINYLRCAMIHMPFDQTNSTVPSVLRVPSPTNLNINSSTRLLSWSYAPGFTSPSNYNVSLRGGEWFTPNSNPLYIGEKALYIGDVVIYTKGAGYYLDSDQIYNPIFIEGGPLYIYINASTYTDAGIGYGRVNVNLSHLPNQDIDILIEGSASYDTDFGEKVFLYSILVNSGSVEGFSDSILEFLPLSEFASINSSSATPNVVDGKTIILSNNTILPIQE